MFATFFMLALLTSQNAATARTGETRSAAQVVTTATLLKQMYDMEALTRIPDPPYRLVQFSSYDRRSNLPGGPEWFANSDGFGSEPIPAFVEVLRQPDEKGIGEYLICDIRQPGAIVRTWTATIEGRIQMFLDDDATPIYDGPAQAFLQNRFASLVAAAGATVENNPFGQRFADYFPIAFAKRCRIVWIGDWRRVHFYHVAVRLYEPAAEVRTFRLSDFDEFADAIRSTARELSNPGASADPSDAKAHTSEQSLAPGEEKEVLRLEGSAAIQTLRIRLDAENVAEALRSTLLNVYFDGAPTPEVRSPVGDFFGAAPGLVPYQTLPMSVSPDGTLTCRFVMPFETGAVLTLDNRGGRPIVARVEAVVLPRPWDDRSLHLRARWRVDHDLRARPGVKATDLPFIVAGGQGLYVGTTVYLMSPAPVPTAGGNWWGEGDEKVFVDDATAPVMFGTGSEDYFNYAWSQADIFMYPYFSQPVCTGPDTRGYITNNRWHIIDPIPFERFLAFYIELYSHADTKISYARMSYYYARPGTIDDSVALEDRDLFVPPLPAWRARAGGFLSRATLFEAEESLTSAGDAEIESNQQYSAGNVVWIRAGAAKPIELKLRVEQSGRQQVALICTSRPEPARFAVTIDGKPLLWGESASVSLETAHIPRLVNVWFTPVELDAGEHLMTIQPLSGDVGVDLCWILPVPER